METQIKPVFLYEKHCKVTEPLGLCARPCCWIVLEVARSSGSAGVGKIFIRREGDSVRADAFSILSLMMLGANQDTKLVVFTNEPGLVEKVDSLAAFIDAVHVHTQVAFSIEQFREVIKESQN